MKKVSFLLQFGTALFCSVAAHLVGWWLDFPALHTVVWLLIGLAFVVHPAVPEKWDSHYQGARGRRIVRMGGAVLMLFVGLLLFFKFRF